MLPLPPDPSEMVGANLRRAYRGTPPDALPDRLVALLSLIAAQTAPVRRPTAQPTRSAERQTTTHVQAR